MCNWHWYIKFAKKADLDSLKLDVDKLDTDKPETTLADLSKLSNLLKKFMLLLQDLKKRFKMLIKKYLVPVNLLWPKSLKAEDGRIIKEPCE